MRQVHKAFVSLLVVFALALAGCAGSGLPSQRTLDRTADGWVTGFADACSGLKEFTYVKVFVDRGRTSVATETIRSGGRFLFKLRPGSYVVTVGHRSASVIVRSKRVASADFLSVCL